jgi:hypothetical protein
MDLRGEPTQLENPPSNFYKEPSGIYAFGAEKSIAEFMAGKRFENREEDV